MRRMKVGHRDFREFHDMSRVPLNPLIWSEFAETTTCHGVREIQRSKRIFWKIFWTISVLVHVVLLFIGCGKVIADYFNAPTVTRVAVVHRPWAPLPSLTFCLSNALNFDLMVSDGVVDSDDFPRRIGSINDLQFGRAIDRYLTRTNQKLEQFAVRYSFTCHDILASCQYGSNVSNHDCCSNARKIHDVKYGVCHVIDEGDVRQLVPGVHGGYRLKFRIPKQRLHNPVFSGLILSLNVDSGSQANLNPILVSPNHLVAVSVRAEFHERVTNGHVPCETTGNNFNSGNACFYWCRAKMFKDKCGCGLYGMSDVYDFELPLCTIRDLKCIQNLTFNSTHQEAFSCQESCKPLCKEWEYKQTVSYAKLSYTNGQSANTVRADVGFSSMEYKEVQEVKSFTVFMAISSLGGQAGLWMGCSILTVIHFVTYCCWAFTLGCTNQIKTVAKRDSVATFLDTSYGYIRRKTRDLSFSNTQEEIRV